MNICVHTNILMRGILRFSNDQMIYLSSVLALEEVLHLISVNFLPLAGRKSWAALLGLVRSGFGGILSPHVEGFGSFRYLVFSLSI